MLTTGAGPNEVGRQEPRCPFAGDRRTPSVALCSGYLATPVALGPVEGSDHELALSCAHLSPRQGRRGWIPACRHPGGLPPDAKELQTALAAHGRGGRHRPPG